MGLTVHYNFASKSKTPREVVEKMRQITMDLPFSKVGKIVELTGQECNVEFQRKQKPRNESLFWLVIQATGSAKCPWHKNHSYEVQPEKIIAFDTELGDGCESANFGLCVYPKLLTVNYEQQYDQQYQDENGIFCYTKWRKKNKTQPFIDSFDKRPKTIATKLTQSWSSFCKTQYASCPGFGGIPNFLRCHITLITALDRMAKIPGLKVIVEDEGRYGPSTYSDDYQEAYAKGEKPTYVPHKGQYSPAKLVQEIGEWNNLVAGMVGALNDAMPEKGEAPILGYSNFEQLEFKGRNNKDLEPFLKGLAKIKN